MEEFRLLAIDGVLARLRQAYVGVRDTDEHWRFIVEAGNELFNLVFVAAMVDQVADSYMHVLGISADARDQIHRAAPASIASEIASIDCALVSIWE